MRSRHRPWTVLAFAAVTLCLAPNARAILKTDVVVLLGAELTPEEKVDEKRLADLGLALLVTPSLTYDGDRRPVRRFLGRRLGSLPFGRKDADAVGLPVPSDALCEKVRLALEKVGVKRPMQLLLVLQHSGGK